MTSDPVTRLNAALEGRYRIERELGAGGMATVYLAEDLKHKRQVAVKVLKPELSALVGADRFLGEIETTAKLQHPHILPLFDSGEAEGLLFFVMPYIEGETLRDRLDREKQLPVDEAVGIARSVAAALSVAHEQGVVHRDIKPGNILLSRGEPVVADFGIALAISHAGGGRLTETGLSVGTPFYMSPEQATGDRDVTAASDVYALGCVLYEMLAGEPPYVGNTAQAILGKILTERPRGLTAVRASVPLSVEGAVLKALEKLPADRFRTAEEFAKALENPAFRYATDGTGEMASAPSASGSPRTRLLARVPWALAALGFLLAGWSLTRPEPPAAMTTLYLSPGELEPRQFVISPDGSTLAAVGRVDRERRVVIRRLDQPAFQVLAETENASFPAFSPDGRWIAYIDEEDEAIRRVSVTGGSPNTLMQVEGLEPGEIHWGPDGGLVFFGFQPAEDREAIFRLADSGGEPEVLLEDASWAWHPRLLPGGRGVLLHNGAARDTRVLDIQGDSVITLLSEAVDARYVETGHLVFAHPDGGLQAVRFDPRTLRVEGEAVPVRDGVSGARFSAPFTVSRNGTLVYIDGLNPGDAIEGRLARLDLRTGEITLDEVLAPRSILQPRFTLEGDQLLFHSMSDGGERNLFAYEHELGIAPRQLTFSESGGTYGIAVSPDGRRVAFASDRNGAPDLWTVSLDGSSPPEILADLPGTQIPTDWVALDRLLFQDAGTSSGNSRALRLLDPTAPDSAWSFLESESVVGDAHVSPDGGLVAYESREFDRSGHVVVRRFPEPGQPLRVSDGEAGGARWSPDGNRLYYWRVGESDTLKVATIRREPSLAVVDTEVVAVTNLREWDLHPSGEWGMLALRNEDSGSQAESSEAEDRVRYVVVLNWFEELRERMGDRR
jgi:Tol biopolymer transport system component